MKDIRKKKLFITIFIIIIISIMLFFTIENIVQADSDINMETQEVEHPENYTEEYKEYLKLSDEEKAKVYVIPRKYNISEEEFWKEYGTSNEENSDNSHIYSDIKLGGINISLIPSSYDLRNSMTIKTENQASRGLCWAYSSLKSLETFYAKHGKPNLSLSKVHLGFLATTGRDKITGGGSFDSSTKPYFEKYGAIDGSKAHFYNSGYFPAVIDGSYYYDYNSACNALKKIPEKYYVYKTIGFPDIKQATDKAQLRNKVKQHIMENGGLYACMQWDRGYYQSSTNSYCYLNERGRTLAGHGVTIIGWDDNKLVHTSYVGDNAYKTGAYLALNSWGKSGSTTDNNGCFWISYDDAYIESDLNGYLEAGTTKEIPVKLESLKVTSKDGTYKKGDVINIVAEFTSDITNYNIIGPVRIKFGDNGKEKMIAEGKKSGKKITYKYTIKNEDNGKLQLISCIGSICGDIQSRRRNINKTTFDGSPNITADNMAPKLTTLKVSSPTKGTYKEGKEIIIIANYNESVYANQNKAALTSKTAPVLKLKFGNGAEKTATFKTANGNTLMYSYIISKNDNGKLAATTYSGTVYDYIANKAIINTKPTLAGNEIIAYNNNIILGDINTDGKINIQDVLKLRRYISYTSNQTIKSKHPDWSLTEEQKKSADTNNDGKINIQDVLKLRRYIAAKGNTVILNKHPGWATLGNL